MKFPVFSLLAGNLAFSETSSQLTPPSSRESRANLMFDQLSRSLWLTQCGCADPICLDRVTQALRFTDRLGNYSGELRPPIPRPNFVATRFERTEWRREGTSHQ